MNLDTTIAQAMSHAERIADAVLDWRQNQEALKATEALLETLRQQQALLGDTSNVVTLRA